MQVTSESAVATNARSPMRHLGRRLLESSAPEAGAEPLGRLPPSVISAEIASPGLLKPRQGLKSIQAFSRPLPCALQRSASCQLAAQCLPIRWLPRGTPCFLGFARGAVALVCSAGPANFASCPLTCRDWDGSATVKMTCSYWSMKKKMKRYLTLCELIKKSVFFRYFCIFRSYISVFADFRGFDKKKCRLRKLLYGEDILHSVSCSP